MTRSTDEQKNALLEQICSIIEAEQNKSRSNQAKIYIKQYFQHVPLEAMAVEEPRALAAMINRQLDFLQVKAAGECLIRVFNPTVEEDGWESQHTIVEVLNDDKPFLVDSASLTFAENGYGVHLIVHPVFRVERTEDRLTELLSDDRNDGHAESFMQFQVDRHTRQSDLEEIEAKLRSAFEDVEAAVADWRAMGRRAHEAKDKLLTWAPQIDRYIIRECRDFLQWLNDDFFVFLGVRDYRIRHTKNSYKLEVVPGSGLGILREDESTVMSRTISNRAENVRNRDHKSPLIITKTIARSTVHRAGYMDYIGVLQFDAEGRPVAERRFLGLFTSMAYNLNAMETPLVRLRVQNVLDETGFIPGNHAWKRLVHILETLPRDELFQANSEELLEISTGVLNLQERPHVHLIIRRERYGRFYSCLVYIPRERFNTENREKIQSILKRALKGKKLDYSVRVSESRLARLHVIVRPRQDEEIKPDVAELERKIVEVVRSWTDGLTRILVDKHGEEKGLQLAERFADAFPEAYKEDVSPWVAAFDVESAAALDGAEDLRMSLYRPRKARSGVIRFKLFRKDQPIPLFDVLPILENLGLRIISERPYELNLGGDERLWIQDFDMVPAAEHDIDLEILRAPFQEAFERAVNGDVDNDPLNQLIIASQMHWHQVKVLRAYCKYLLQTGVPFSLNYMAETLAKHPCIARLLIELFEAMFEPERENETEYRQELAARKMERRFKTLLGEEGTQDAVLLEYVDEMVEARGGGRENQAPTVRAVFKRALEGVSSLDEDRILFAFYQVIGATLRTNHFQLDDTGRRKEYISFKLDSKAVPDLPLPRPFREIWVYSPRFEGIHLRGGRIARGGLRWSDRREDFRTEVLGLMKAQNVKNTVIVPVGSKGGFVLKKPPTSGGRDAYLQEGIACYSKFISGLLDITDNLEEEKILPPADVVRRDDDDSYLVVAADKGTATFSDIANGIAQRFGFWLGDAFASGGSVGYDHKGMGITARGAWESVKRHFRELGIDTQSEPFTVVGIGDMAGDVFGNGMLLSPHIRLQAAFNHLHIFIDPDPDAGKSFEERKRLFAMPGSAWTDYDRGLISAGGGVYSRQDKTIPISPEVREWLGIEDESLTPQALIRELLKAPVDLLWNGGIGTYVKATQESHADVGDMSNNALRVNGNELRCKVVGEGGNLGLTQLGRMEFAAAGGKLNTDFIDNSAGVATSDHEVNIKILLNQAVRAGEIDEEERNQLLASMTDEVAELVLRGNYLQTQALSMMEHLSRPRLGSKQHFINVLEDEGLLDRQLEFLPDDEELTERRNLGEGMNRPELCVLLSYSKIRLYQQMLESDIPEDPFLSDELVRYFPSALRERFAGHMPGHRLKREIIATQVTNSLVNRMGASFTLRMHEDTGADPATIARAYSVARAVFEARTFWNEVEALDNRVSAELQITALQTMWELLRQTTRWLLSLPGKAIRIQAAIDRIGPGVATLAASLESDMQAEEKLELEQEMLPYLEGGFPEELARRVAMLPRLFPTLDVVETAARHQMDVQRVADVYFGLGEKLGLQWLRSKIESLEVLGQWHARARANLRDEFLTQQNLLVEQALKFAADENEPVQAWMNRHHGSIEQVLEMMGDMQKNAVMDYATVAVAVRSLASLAEAEA